KVENMIRIPSLISFISFNRLIIYDNQPVILLSLIAYTQKLVCKCIIIFKQHKNNMSILDYLAFILSFVLISCLRNASHARSTDSSKVLLCFFAKRVLPGISKLISATLFSVVSALSRRNTTAALIIPS